MPLPIDERVLNSGNGFRQRIHVFADSELDDQHIFDGQIIHKNILLLWKETLFAYVWLKYSVRFLYLVFLALPALKFCRVYWSVSQMKILFLHIGFRLSTLYVRLTNSSASFETSVWILYPFSNQIPMSFELSDNFILQPRSDGLIIILPLEENRAHIFVGFIPCQALLNYIV